MRRTYSRPLSGERTVSVLGLSLIAQGVVMRLKVHSCRRCLLVCALFLTSSALNAQSLGGAAAKQNLDLPVNAITDDREDEEAPETVSFYGRLFESDVVVFVVSREGGMQVRGDLDAVKRELANAISQFTERMQFGIVFYDRGVEQFRRHEYLQQLFCL